MTGLTSGAEFEQIQQCQVAGACGYTLKKTQ